MEPVVLRHRSICQVCQSKLPPRSEAWWDDETGRATCPTCHRLAAVVGTAAAPVLDREDAVPPPEAPSPAPAEPPQWWEPAPTARRDLEAEARLVHPEWAPEIDGQAVDLLRSLAAQRAREAREPAPGVPGAAGAPTSEVAEPDPITDTLDAARPQGILTLHHRRVPASGELIDHLVVAPTGLWIVHDEPAPAGRVERRDLGDWFSSDPRFFVADDDRSDTLRAVRGLVDAVGRTLAGTPVEALPRRGVVCFVEVTPGWFAHPFALEEVSITWRMHVVEPMLSAILYGPPIRAELARYLDSVFPAA